VQGAAAALEATFVYYNSNAEIAWTQPNESDDVVSEHPGGLRDYDRVSHKLVADADALGQILDAAVHYDLIEHNPVKTKVTKLKEAKPKRARLTGEQVQACPSRCRAIPNSDGRPAQCVGDWAEAGRDADSDSDKEDKEPSSAKPEIPHFQALLDTGATGLEPAASGVTGRRSNQLSYAPRDQGRGLPCGDYLRVACLWALPLRLGGV
jgi:hypothetical protein